MGHRDTKYIRLSALVAKGEGAELPDLECCKAPASSTKRLHVPLPIFVVRNPFGRGTLFHLVSNGSNLLHSLQSSSAASLTLFSNSATQRFRCFATPVQASSLLVQEVTAPTIPRISLQLAEWRFLPIVRPYDDRHYQRFSFGFRSTARATSLSVASTSEVLLRADPSLLFRSGRSATRPGSSCYRVFPWLRGYSPAQ
jgi:hypothetical protein